MIIVSTLPVNASIPRSACSLRFLPSKPNGFVTTPTVNAPASRAHSATTGAAPVPVPPPIPAVTKTMSAPCNAFKISSRLSSAASRPTSGFAPAPKPLVAFSPIWMRTGTLVPSNACVSVLATRKSTFSKSLPIIRDTAFPPPPPTPITLIFANSDIECSSSLLEIYFICYYNDIILLVYLIIYNLLLFYNIFYFFSMKVQN